MINLFFSYSHKDEDLRDELEIHLSALKRQEIISAWHDRRIVTGEEFGNEISEYLEASDIILLLISPYFIASDYCYNIEMKHAMEKHNRTEAIVIPVILHPCDWHDMPFSSLLACPQDGKPVSKFPNLHEAFLDITQAIKNACSKLKPNNTPSQAHSDESSILVKAKSEQLRSSNLRLKREFTDREKNKFLVDGFDFLSNYFEGSLAELQDRNKEIETVFRRIDANRFTATIYNNGKEASKCNIWLSDSSHFTSPSIKYSTGSYSSNSYNDAIDIDDNGYTIYFTNTASLFFLQDKQEELSFEGASEYYWSMLIKYLQ